MPRRCHVVATSLPRYCHVVATSLPCHHRVVATSLPRRSHVIATLLFHRCHVVVTFFFAQDLRSPHAWRGLFEWGGAEKERVVTHSKEGCQCSGHCYVPGHRYWGGCSCKLVVVDASHCKACICAIPGCLSPRLHGAVCSQHGKILKAAKPGLQVAFAARANANIMMPCDVPDF